MSFFPPIYSIASDSITRYYEYPERRKKLVQSEKSRQNLSLAKNTGSISYNTRQMLRKKLQCYFDCMYSVGSYYRKKNNIMHVIITLTLCHKQIHSDNVIKKECLGRWLSLAQSKYHVNFYYWIAEKQKNGNIHFHVLSDRFMSHEWVRSSWNARLDKLGYLDKFYEEHGHRNPNSTDIQAIKSLALSSKYVTKYTSKCDQQGDLEGRLWGCSDSFRNMKKFKMYGSHDYDLKIKEWIDAGKVKLFEHEHCIAVFGNIRDLLDKECPMLFNQMKKYYKEMANSLYDIQPVGF